MPPELWLLLGGNGSGKSTFYDHFLAQHGIPLVNADAIARRFWPDAPEAHSYEAALLAEKERFRLLREQQTFCFESVFSHPSKVDFVARAKASGYQIRIFYFHLANPLLNLARVACRVDAGGHAVPADKVMARIPRSLDNLTRVVGLADELHLIDNASAEEPYRRVALWRNGDWTRMVATPPDWAEQMMR